MISKAYQKTEEVRSINTGLAEAVASRVGHEYACFVINVNSCRDVLNNKERLSTHICITPALAQNWFPSSAYFVNDHDPRPP